jgi:signal transduction histidine kinase/GAF domain-containing protein
MATQRDLELELKYRLTQQGWLSEFASCALQNRDLRALLQEASRLAAAGLATRFAKVLQYIPAENRFLVVAGVGWKPGVVGFATIAGDFESPAGYALHTGEPVLSDHQSREGRFRFPPLLIEHGITRAINVIIRGAEHPFGVLEVDSSGDRAFSRHDLDFLQSTAHMLAAAIERQHADEAISENDERVRLALEAGKLGSWQIELPSWALTCSATCKENFGRGADEPFSYDDLIAAIHPADRRRLRRAIDRALRDGSDCDAEYRIDWPDGSTHYIHVRGGVIGGPDGAPLRLIGVTQDTTFRKRAVEELARHRDHLEQLVAERTADLERSEAERRQAQEILHQVQKMEVIGQMTGGIAHDFNNLLTVVVANLDLLHNMMADRKPARRLIDKAQNAAARAGQLTNQLLTFARRQALNPETVNLNEVFGDFEGLLRRAAGEAVEVVIRPSGRPALCDIDRSHFEAAMLNLTINARDAMPTGGTLTIETDEVDLDDDYARMNVDVAAGRYVRVVVGDSGTGMSAATLAHAFEPFFTTKEVGRGTGLGLSQVYGFVKQSGGHVTLDSEFGQGTTVRIYLPRSTSRKPAAARTAGASPKIARGRETILVVDDDDDVLDVATHALTGFGYTVLVARDGPTALAIIESGRPLDLLFTDVVMPSGMTGIELARRACRARPGLKVVLTSGYPAQSLSGKTGVPGEFTLVGKPYRPAQLGEVIRATLSASL